MLAAVVGHDAGGKLTRNPTARRCCLHTRIAQCRISKARRPRAEYASPSADISTAACLLDELL